MPVAIGRRELIATLGGAAAWPLAARAQLAGKLPTIGFLVPNTRSTASEWIDAFVQRLRELGWIEGRTVAIEYRWVEGQTERFAEIAAEFARLNMNVIVTSGTPAVQALQAATSTIPIVFATAGDRGAGRPRRCPLLHRCRNHPCQPNSDQHFGLARKITDHARRRHLQ